ncbi:MAG TPA: hypothetical protein VGG85_07965 [Terracidiphilus sp.]|jgi:predicted DNA-binding mobile mystery protein A
MKPAAGLRGSAEERQLKITALAYQEERKGMGLGKRRKAAPDEEPAVPRQDAVEEAVAAFRMADRALGEVESWVRLVRKMVGMPVEELAEKLGVQRCEVYRMERAEAVGRVGLLKLRDTARAMDCELVYALVPKSGTLQRLMTRHAAVRAEAEEKRREGAEKKLVSMGWKDVMRRALRKYFRKAGLRLR